MRRVLIVVIAIAVLVVGALIAAAVHYRPYWRQPPEPAAALDARLETFRALVARLAERPPDARNRLTVLLAESKSELKDRVAEFDPARCAPLADPSAAPGGEMASLVHGWDSAWRALAAAGFVFRVDPGLEAQTLDGVAALQFARAQLAVALGAAAAGNVEDAVARLADVYAFARGLADAPALVHVMLGLVIERDADRTFLRLLPTLDYAANRRLRDLAAAMPNYYTAFADALGLDAANVIEVFDLPENLKQFGVFGYVPWIMRREQRVMVSLTGRLVDFYAALTPDDAPAPLPPPLGAEPIKGLLATIAMPAYGQFHDRLNEMFVLRRATIAAADHLAANPTDLPWRAPIDAGSQVVVTTDFGCVAPLQP